MNEPCSGWGGRDWCWANRLERGARKREGRCRLSLRSFAPRPLTTRSCRLFLKGDRPCVAFLSNTFSLGDAFLAGIYVSLESNSDFSSKDRCCPCAVSVPQVDHYCCRVTLTALQLHEYSSSIGTRRLIIRTQCDDGTSGPSPLCILRRLGDLRNSTLRIQQQVSRNIASTDPCHVAEETKPAHDCESTRLCAIAHSSDGGAARLAKTCP